MTLAAAAHLLKLAADEAPTGTYGRAAEIGAVTGKFAATGRLLAARAGTVKWTLTPGHTPVGTVTGTAQRHVLASLTPRSGVC